MRVYRNMLSRVVGIQRRQVYIGLPILPKQVFYAWAWGDPEFWRLWKRWQASGRQQTFTPSIDRIDETQGYTLDNMRWLTHGDNSRLTARYKEQHAISSCDV